MSADRTGRSEMGKLINIDRFSLFIHPSVF